MRSIAQIDSILHLTTCYVILRWSDLLVKVFLVPGRALLLLNVLYTFLLVYLKVLYSMTFPVRKILH